MPEKYSPVLILVFANMVVFLVWDFFYNMFDWVLGGLLCNTLGSVLFDVLMPLLSKHHAIIVAKFILYLCIAVFANVAMIFSFFAKNKENLPSGPKQLNWILQMINRKKRAAIKIKTRDIK